MSTYALGLDYGTNSCRSLIVDLETGRELASQVFPYPSGERGIVTDPRDPNLARQHPADYLAGLERIVVDGLAQARDADPSFAPARVVGIGIDATGSTPLPVDPSGMPLALRPDFRENPDAMAWLWKDHTSHAEAAAITALAADQRPAYLARCGGVYSSEWFWAKILHLKRAAPEVFDAAFSFVELCDWLPGLLTGCADPRRLRRSICAAGHKALFSSTWGGLPDPAFLGALDPALAELRGRLYATAHTSDVRAGGLCDAWARRLGLPAGLAVAVGAIDAHVGAVGAGCAPGRPAKILGTSTCDLMVAPPGQPVRDIPGVCGIVEGSVLPGCFAIEAGQAAVGDLFLWFAEQLAPDAFGTAPGARLDALERAAATLAPGESGLLALDWNNGNRNLLADVRLSGLLLGQTLRTTAPEIYRALIEATAFGARMIIDRVREYGVPVEQMVACGGLAVRSPLLMQIYADVLERPLAIAASDQTCALGAAVFGAVAGGAFRDVTAAQRRLCRMRDQDYRPVPARSAVYRELLALYRQLHDAFGVSAWQGSMAGVMKGLIAIRERQRGG